MLEEGYAMFSTLAAVDFVLSAKHQMLAKSLHVEMNSFAKNYWHIDDPPNESQSVSDVGRVEDGKIITPLGLFSIND